MPTRPVYRLPTGEYPPTDPETGSPAQFGDVVEVARNTTSVYLLSAVDPNARLEAMGAERLADDLPDAWIKLPAVARDRVFLAHVRRREQRPDGTEGDVHRRVPRADVDDADTVEQQPLIPVAFGVREARQWQDRVDREVSGG